MFEEKYDSLKCGGCGRDRAVGSQYCSSGCSPFASVQEEIDDAYSAIK